MRFTALTELAASAIVSARIMCVSTRTGAVGTSRIRRAAGTKTVTDLMLNYEQNRRVSRGLPATDPALDLEYLAAGEALAVLAHRRVDSQLRKGMLILRTQGAEPITWFPGFPRRAKSGLSMRPPITVDVVGDVSGKDAWRVRAGMSVVINAHAGGEPWTLAVRTIDLDLVLAAFAAVSTQQQATS
jgi:hypothetical protein